MGVYIKLASGLSTETFCWGCTNLIMTNLALKGPRDLQTRPLSYRFLDIEVWAFCCKINQNAAPVCAID